MKRSNLATMTDLLVARDEVVPASRPPLVRLVDQDKPENAVPSPARTLQSDLEKAALESFFRPALEDRPKGALPVLRRAARRLFG